MHIYKIVEKGMPLAQAEKAIVMLHGRGSDANNIISLADSFVNRTFYIAAPQATNNSWYPYSFISPEARNEPWLSSAISTVQRLLDNISKKIPLEKTYIMGFSQGACLSVEVASRNAKKYAGVIAFTGGLIGDRVREEKYKGNFEGTRVFLGNSNKDPHVPLIRSEETKVIMQNLGADVMLKIYPDMQHTIIQDEIDTVLKLMF
jgi:phospholipase/carboxylesterase